MIVCFIILVVESSFYCPIMKVSHVALYWPFYCSMVTLHFPVGSETLIQTLLVRQDVPAAEENTSLDEDVNRVQDQYEASKV